MYCCTGNRTGVCNIRLPRQRHFFIVICEAYQDCMWFNKLESFLLSERFALCVTPSFSCLSARHMKTADTWCCIISLHTEHPDINITLANTSLNSGIFHGLNNSSREIHIIYTVYCFFPPNHGLVLLSCLQWRSCCDSQQ